MEPFEKLTEICESLRDSNITRLQVYDSILESGLYSELRNSLQDYRYFVFDGKFDDLLEKVVYERVIQQQSTFKTYDEFLSVLSSEMKKWVVPTVIVLPLVFVQGVGNEEKETVISFSNDKFFLFPLSKNRKPFKKEILPLCQHIEKTIYAKLLYQHILTTKDENFFNYPILTIQIHDIDSRVEREALKIIEATYCFIRMIGLGNDTKSGKWPIEWPPFPHTYSVYYNQVGTSPNPPYDSGYGYSFRFTFSQLLDVDFETFINQKQVFSDNLEKFISFTFMSRKDTSGAKYARCKKWQNSVLLFNEAYELASREKYDSSLLFLFAILESLFLKNNGRGKQEQLIKALQAHFNDPSINQFIEVTVGSLYKKRNAFMHEGTRIATSQIYKPLNDMDGLIQGMEPLTFQQHLSDDDALKQLSDLFQLCRDILLHFEIQ